MNHDKQNDPFGLRVYAPSSSWSDAPHKGKKTKPFDVQAFIKEYVHEFGDTTPQSLRPNILTKIIRFSFLHLLDLVFLFLFMGMTAIGIWYFFNSEISANHQSFKQWSFTRLLLSFKLKHFLMFTYGLFFFYWLTFKLLAGETLAKFFCKKI